MKTEMTDKPVMTVLDALIAGRALIEDPKHWTRKFNARDADGHPVWNTKTQEPISWCSLGALSKVTEGTTKVYNGAYKVLRACVDAGVSDFNDSHSHSEVLALWDKAIEAERFRHSDATSQGDGEIGVVEAILKAHKELQ